MSAYIAIIDDDEAVRTALRRLLRCAHHEVEAYGSGREFLESLDRHTPDCLVLDMQMPEMSGLQILRHLSAIGTSIPAVMITGHDEVGAQEACLAAGASSYLRKPIDLSVLLEAIERAISSPRSGQGSNAQVRGQLDALVSNQVGRAGARSAGRSS